MSKTRYTVTHINERGELEWSLDFANREEAIKKYNSVPEIKQHIIPHDRFFLSEKKLTKKGRTVHKTLYAKTDHYIEKKIDEITGKPIPLKCKECSAFAPEYKDFNKNPICHDCYFK